MNINVKLFARARELACAPEVKLSLPAGTTASGAIHALVSAAPALREISPYLRVAVNHRLVEPEHPITEGDEVAMLPPMSGG